MRTCVRWAGCSLRGRAGRRPTGGCGRVATWGTPGSCRFASLMRPTTPGSPGPFSARSRTPTCSPCSVRQATRSPTSSTWDGGMRAGAFTTADGRARLAGRVGPEFFAQTLTPSLARLSPAARRLVDVAAVLGPSFRMADVSALVEAPASRLTAEVRELCSAGLVTDGRNDELA